MIPASTGRPAFWRGLSFVLAGVAAAEAVGLLAVRPTPPRPMAPAAMAPVSPGIPPLAAPIPTQTGQAPALEASAAPPPAATAPGIRNPRQRVRRLEDQGAALAASDPAAALRALEGYDTKADRAAMLRGIFGTLAQGDPAQALAYAKQIKPGVDRESALAALLETWNGTADDTSGDRTMRTAHYGPEAGLGMTLLQGNAPRPDLAVLWAQQLTSGQAQATLLGMAAGIQAAADPALAASYGDGLTGKARLVFNDLLVASWTHAQPDAAWQWSSALADPAARTRAQNTAVAALSEQSPPTAAAWLSLLPDDGQRRTTLSTVAENYAQTNTDAALSWAQSLPAADQAAAKASIAAVTPVGIGTLLHIDPDGYPVVDSLVPSAAAERSGLVHPGDRIMGVSQGDGPFVDVQTLDFSQVVGLVRGAPGSVVRLQVASALPGGGFATPTVVTVVRQQLKQGS